MSVPPRAPLEVFRHATRGERLVSCEGLVVERVSFLVDGFPLPAVMRRWLPLVWETTS